jgi:hypothetical protein
MGNGFSATKAVVIYSLEPHEVNTGKIVADYIRQAALNSNISFPVELIKVENYLEFLQVIQQQTYQAALTGDKPLIHVECHGHPHDGLEFENASTLSWPQVADALRELNIATRFNLMSVFSACFGGYFLGQMGVVEAAPCWGLVAPTDEINPAEIIAGFRVFYDVLFRYGDATVAINSISMVRVENGRWFGQGAEDWFERTVIGYIRNHCTKAATLQRLRKMHRKSIAEGRRISLGRLRRELIRMHRSSFLERNFDKYFMVDAIPENAVRFDAVKKRVAQKINSLRRTKRYDI